MMVVNTQWSYRRPLSSPCVNALHFSQHNQIQSKDNEDRKYIVRLPPPHASTSSPTSSPAFPSWPPEPEPVPVDWDQFDYVWSMKHFFYLVPWTEASRKYLQRHYGKDETKWPKPVVRLSELTIKLWSRKLDARAPGLTYTLTKKQAESRKAHRLRQLTKWQNYARRKQVSVTSARFFNFDKHADKRLMRAVTMDKVLGNFAKFLNVSADVDLVNVKRVDASTGYDCFLSHTWSSNWKLKALSIAVHFSVFRCCVVTFSGGLVLSCVVFIYWTAAAGSGRVKAEDFGLIDSWVMALADWPRQKVVPGAAPGLYDGEPFEHKPFPTFKCFRLMVVLLAPILVVTGWKLKRQRSKFFFDRLSIEQREGIHCKICID